MSKPRLLANGVVEIKSDPVADELLSIIAAARRGEIVSLTLVSTDSNGQVSCRNILNAVAGRVSVRA